MKKILFAFIPLSVLFACGPSEEQVQKDEDYEQLLEETAQRDSAMLELVKTLNLIDENISKISDKKDELDLHANDVEFRKTYREKMLDDIQEIYEDMQKNQKHIDELNARISSLRDKLGQSQKENKRLNEMIDQYQIMVSNLNNKLEKKDQEIYALNEQLLTMDISLDSLREVVGTKHEELNTVFFSFGTKKELIYHNVIDKKGGFAGIGKSLQMKPDFNKGYFTKANAESLVEIELYVKKANILSTHDQASYHFVGENTVEKLVIDDHVLFWQASKYLVIEVVQ